MDSPYISVTYTAKCGPPVTSVTATLLNISFNPQFVSIGSGTSTGIAVVGTVKNVSISPKLHSFTIQIPFTITLGTLNCDMSRSYGGPGTCSVSNNVLTVTQTLPPLYFGWGPGFSKQIGYAYVGTSLPNGLQCCSYVTWGTPTVIAAS